MPITPTSTKSKNYQALGIDEIARDIETAFDAINQLEQGGGGSDYTETIVNISSAQILDMHMTPIELLPAAGANAYYDIDKVIFEYTHVTTPYTVTPAKSILIDNGYSYSYVDQDILAQSSNYVAISRGIFESSVVHITTPTPLNSPISLILETAVTDGDGTLRVKIYSKTITFGA
jgi:hypothetical protein